MRTATTTYPFSASQFVTWGTHRSISPRIKGIIEHYAHHIAVSKYQLQSVPQPQNGDSWLTNENMPSVVRLATLAKSEENIALLFRDLNLYGRIDQMYQYDGTYFLVDTKSHASPTFSDQLQLSFYSFILSRLGYRMAPAAFVRSCYGNQVHYEAVDIIPHDAMSEIIGEVE